MPAGFKIAEAYVAAVPRDQDFEAGLRAIVEPAALRVHAEVGLGLTHEAPGELRGDLDAALALATDGLDANVGMGLRNDAVEALDADVRAGVQLVEDNNKIRVKVDPKTTADAQQAGMSIGAKLALGMGALFGPATLVEAATVGVPLMIGAIGTILAARSPQVQASAKILSADIGGELSTAAAPLVPAAQDAISQFDALFRDEMPRLQGYFTQARPAVDILTGGLTGFVTNVLPGFDAGMAHSQQASAAFAQGLDLAGDGVAHLIQGLSAGTSGGAQGFVALMTLVDHVLGIIGTDLGRLANAAGPVAQQLEPVLSAVAGDLSGATTSTIVTGLGLVNSILSTLPVDVVRAMADATAAWYTSSKVYGLLSGLGPALVGAATKVKLLSAAEVEAAGGAEAMGASWGKTLGTLGLVISAAALGGEQLGKLAGVGDHTAADVDTLTSSLMDAANGSQSAGTQITQFAGAMAFASNIAGGKATDGMKSLDDALTKLYQSNPQQAATEFQAVSDAMQAQGTSAQDVAKYLPGYTQAVKDAALANKEHADALATALSPAQQFTQALIGQQQQLVSTATASASATIAAMSFGTTQGGLNQQLSDALTDYQLAKNAASAYGTALAALSGSYGDLQAAEAQVDSNLLTLIQHQQQSGHAFTTGTQAGDQNIQMMHSYTQSILQGAQALVQQDTQAGRTSQVTQDLTAYINQQRNAFIQQEAKILGSRDAAAKLFDQYVDIKKLGTITTTINANTRPAAQALNGLIELINSSTGTVQIYATPNNPAGGRASNARGGPVYTGEVSEVGEEGPEVVVFGAPGRVIPNDQIPALPGGGAPPRTGASGGGITIQTLTVPVTVHGVLDFTDPNSLSPLERQMAARIGNAIRQVERSRVGV